MCMGKPDAKPRLTAEFPSLSVWHSILHTDWQGLEEASFKQAKIEKPMQEWKEGLYNIYGKLCCYYSAAKRCFTIVVLEKTLESPLDNKEIKPVNPRGNQPWILTGRTDTEAEALILYAWCEQPVHWKRQWCWERFESKRRKRVAEDEMVGKHHSLNGHELGQTLGDSEGQGGLVCCSPWGCKKSDMT